MESNQLMVGKPVRVAYRDLLVHKCFVIYVERS